MYMVGWCIQDGRGMHGMKGEGMLGEEVYKTRMNFILPTEV